VAFTLANFYTEVRARLQDQDAGNPHLSNDDLDTAARASVLRISQDQPKETLVEFVGDGGKWYVLGTVLPAFVEKFSIIRWIEYPASVVADDDPPTALDPSLDYLIWPVLVSSVRTLHLFFPHHQPLATETVRVAHTVLHTLDELDDAAETSVGTAWEQAFYHLGAGYALEQAAALMAQKGEPTVQADVVDHPDMTRRLAERSKFWFGQYFMAIGLDKDGKGGAGSGWADWDISSDTGRDLLFHGRRGR
jgi:hypothetical protein